MIVCAAWCAAMLGGTGLEPEPGGPPRISATIVTTYIWTDPPAMFLPTDIAVAPDGTLYVADGVNNRVLCFDNDGTPRDSVTAIAQHPLVRPVGLTVDSTGRLWVANSGAGQVLVRRPHGGLDSLLDVPGIAAPHDLDVTDIAVSADGLTAWLVDNDNHRILAVSPAQRTTRVFGRSGTALGELRYPFNIDLDNDGNVLVSDVLNGRVAVFASDGSPRLSYAAYGVELGQVYRPKGLARDPQGQLWVSDSVLNVIQAFRADRRVIDVLRTPDGRRFEFRGPMGLDFDADGHLYVVEMEAHRVIKLRITTQPMAPREISRWTGATQRQHCTVCHLEMTPPLSEGTPTALARVPPNDPNDPLVSHERMCLSCHDGSVADSRRTVWVDHGHRLGVVPETTRNIPASLPLVDGALACRTCHSAHASGRFDQDIATAVFMRLPTANSELCIACHTDQPVPGSGVSHPLASFEAPFPAQLSDAGAQPSSTVSCQTCHTAHGSQYAQLLRMDRHGNDLCVACHTEAHPMTTAAGWAGHPIGVALDGPRQQIVKDMGGIVGQDGQMLCMSCHAAHHARSERYLLTTPGADSTLCHSCHPGHDTVIGSSHDMSLSCPQRINALGQTAGESGPCSACHQAHPAPSSVALLNPCMSCHQANGCASAIPTPDLSHPGACTSCHNPHDDTLAHYLSEPRSVLCMTCHEDMYAVENTAHAAQAIERVWPQGSSGTADACGVCHRVHGTVETTLFAVRPSSAMPMSDGACVACHPQSGWATGGMRAAQHPAAEVAGTTPGLPLVGDSANTATRIGCKTCHDPHGLSAGQHLVRTVEPGRPASVCTRCHPAAENVDLTVHGRDSLDHAGLTVSGCQPCHSAHAIPDMPERGLTLALDSDPNGGCTVCHRDGGTAAPPAISGHPRMPMRTIGTTTTRGYLPLFDALGAAEQGEIRCSTCHLPHGLPLSDPGLGTSVADFPWQRRRAARLMLRPFSGPNTCTTCHGMDALQRFLRYHDPLRRGGPLPDPLRLPDLIKTEN